MYDSIKSLNSNIKNVSINKSVSMVSEQTGGDSGAPWTYSSTSPTVEDPRTTASGTGSSDHILEWAINITNSAALYLDAYREIIRADKYPETEDGAKKHYKEKGA